MSLTVALWLFFIVAFLTSILRRIFFRRDVDLRLVIRVFRRRLIRVLFLCQRSYRNDAAHHGCHQNSFQLFHNYLWPPHVSFTDERAWEGERRDAPSHCPAIWMP